MDAENRRDVAALSDEEIATLSRYSFQQLVSVLDRMAGEAARTGLAGDPELERVRFRAVRSLGFPSEDVDSLQRLPANRDLLELHVAFLGLYGPSSPLPPSYTEEIIQRDPGDGAAEDFLDFFNHRLIGLVHILWRKYRYYLRYRQGARDPLSARVGALFGLPPAGRHSDELPYVPSLLAQTGLLSLYSRSGRILAELVADYFRVPAEIEEFVSRVVEIPEDQRTRLGVERTRLGEDFVLSERVIDVTGKFRLKIGAIDFRRLCEFLPPAPDHLMLTNLIRLVLHEPLEWEMEVRLAPGEAPAWRLGEQRLGWTTWMAPDEAVEQRVALAPWAGKYVARGVA